MKRKFFKFAAIALLLAGTVIACERKIDDQEASIIEKKIDGISFKFCLLNEQGEPATVFNEGENFSFYFSVTNCSKKDFYHNGYLILSDKKFLRVYGSSSFDFGKSYKPLPQTDIGIAAYPFDDGDVYTVKVPWIHEKDSVFCAGNFCYNSIVQKPLAKGKYYTHFMYHSSFYEKHSDNIIKIDSIDFKINFKIQ